jgi:hypothetical protein
MVQHSDNFRFFLKSGMMSQAQIVGDDCSDAKLVVSWR